MFGSPSKRVQAVQVLDTRPMTKLQYYAKYFGTTGIVFLVLSLIAIVLGALALGGVIHAKGYTDEIGELNSLVQGLNGLDSSLGVKPLTDDSFGLATSNVVIEAIKSFVKDNPNWADIASKQDSLVSFAQGVVFFGSIIAFVSLVIVAVCAFLGRLDVKFTKKQEQKHLEKLWKAEYRTAKRVTAYQNAVKNRALHKNLKQEYKAKKH